ncbi:TIGR00701 family protein [Helicobacter sp. 13S00482-2]|uniref:protoporphyrinogen oxidase HemJ n=1 Tax=Helicobacter sp. 13S00482-2 TaxID=1476200 RepID=UPI000BA65590|nr:protoporphyrinogen oxidase HemJ [Helicobacter sp. 13S00482-2]PAF53219.1 TIGR00701 family protein [Helicobacter sp. 13S00482-2]
MEILSEYYSWIKVMHIIAFVSWMAMLFYLPRIFVYHSENRSNKSYTDIAKVQERKLYSFIGKPAMVLTLITGILMIAINPTLFKMGAWLHLKLLFVVFLLIYHFVCGYYLKRFKDDRCEKSGIFFRIFNEIPTLCLIVITICAVIKF